MSVITFEVSEDKTEGGYIARALEHGIHTQAETFEALRMNVLEAVDCHFDESMNAPKIISMHFAG